jgi:colicin import membrane protein
MSIPHLPDALRLLTLALALAQPPAACAVTGRDEAAQRARIARERAAVEREAAQAQAACAQRFAVTACVDRARAESRARLRPLELERATLDEQVRQRRAADRLQRLQQRQVERAAEASAVVVRTRQPKASEPEAASVVPAPSAASAAVARQAAASQAETDAQRRVAASAKRTAQAEQHRLAIEQRQRERAKQRPPAAPLPLPTAKPAGP